MKKDIHPTDYRPVIIKDSNSDFAILTKSTATTEETIKWTDGKEYPLVTVHISSASHPFYTGEEKVLDIEGRVDKFKARAEAAAKKKSEATAKAKKALNKTANEDTSQKIGGGSAPKAQKSEVGSSKLEAKDKKTEEKEEKVEVVAKEDTVEEKPAEKAEVATEEPKEESKTEEKTES